MGKDGIVNRRIDYEKEKSTEDFSFGHSSVSLLCAFGEVAMFVLEKYSGLRCIGQKITLRRRIHPIGERKEERGNKSDLCPGHFQCFIKRFWVLLHKLPPKLKNIALFSLYL